MGVKKNREVNENLLVLDSRNLQHLWDEKREEVHFLASSRITINTKIKGFKSIDLNAPLLV